MVLTARSRERNKTIYIGRKLYKGSVNSTRATHGIYEKCDDFIGDYGNDHTLAIDVYDQLPCRFNGTSGNWTYDNWYQYVGIPSHVGSGWSTSYLATLAAARTNPSRPHVQLPVAIAELRDVPQLIRIAGRNLLQKVGGANLLYNFGWKPLIQDLIKLCMFNDVYEKRKLELQRLMSSKGLRRRVAITSQDWESVGSEMYLMSSPTIKAIPTTRTNRSVTAVINWKPSVNLFTKNDVDFSRRLRYTLLGLHPSQILSNVWEGLPWSWLTDWCLNIGDFLQASNNSIAHLSGPVNLIYSVKTERTFEFTVKPSYMTPNPGPPVQKREFKGRYLGHPSVTATIPFLSGKQLSILGSLAILRSR